MFGLVILIMHIILNDKIDNPKLVALLYLFIGTFLFYKPLEYQLKDILIFAILYLIYWLYFYLLNIYYKRVIYYILIAIAVIFTISPYLLTITTAKI